MADEKNILTDPSQVVLGGMYKANPDDVGANKTCGREQNYGRFVAFQDESDGTVWMIDTYHISSPSVHKDTPGDTRDDQVLNGFFSEVVRPHAFITKCVFDCYYNACVKLTEDNCGKFEFLCDLSEYRAATHREARDYDKADIVEDVKLWRDHAYPQGICLIRKGAVPTAARMLDARLSEIRSNMHEPHVRCDFDELEELFEQAGDYDEVKFRAFKHLFRKMSQLQEEWNEFRRDVRMLEETGNIESFDVWEQGVPASDICA